MVIKIWKVPTSRNSPDGIDYSLSLISVEGKRVIGYDNHWPKGHHRHVGRGSVRLFGIDRLIADFRSDVAAVRKKP
jgi:hypothetical protein